MHEAIGCLLIQSVFFFFFGKKTTFLRYRTVCMACFIVLLRILAILEGIFFFFYFLNIFIFNDIT
jgi:hypothetical protein